MLLIIRKSKKEKLVIREIDLDSVLWRQTYELLITKQKSNKNVIISNTSMLINIFFFNILMEKNSLRKITY